MTIGSGREQVPPECVSAADSAEGIQAALDAVMAPFDFNLASTPEGNPDGEWDRWRIDAGDEDRFVVRPEYDGEPRLRAALDELEFELRLG